MKIPDVPTDGDLEKLLARLSPAPPAGPLLERLQNARPRHARLRIVRWIVPLAAAAAIALALIPSRAPTPFENTVQVPTPSAKPETLHAIESRQFLVDLTDLGITSDSESGPVRMILTTWVDQISYAEPGAAPEVSQSLVRREVVPVSLPVF